jgi:hypothetical protein
MFLDASATTAASILSTPRLSSRNSFVGGVNVVPRRLTVDVPPLDLHALGASGGVFVSYAHEDIDAAKTLVPISEKSARTRSF